MSNSNDNKAESGEKGCEAILGPEPHNLQEVDQVLLLDLNRCAAYLVREECIDCDTGFKGVRIVGERPETVSEFEQVLYELYESFYEEPRSISFVVLQKLVPPDADPGTRNALAAEMAEAVDIGCQDADSGLEKRKKHDIVERIRPDEA